MMKFFRFKPALVKETSLSRFVHHASSAEKRRVYNHIIREATDEQREVLKTFQERRVHEKSAHA